MSTTTTVGTVPAKVGQTKVQMHYRWGVNTAVQLSALAQPRLSGPNVGEVRTPQTVWLQVEAGQANNVYYTVDGTTPSATNGMQVPVAPAQIALPYPDQLRNTGTASTSNPQIMCYAAALTYVQVLYEFV